jgi:hypothetical protein
MGGGSQDSGRSPFSGIGGVGGAAYNAGIQGKPELITDRLKLIYGPQTWFNPEDRKSYQDLMEDLLRRMQFRMRDVPQDDGREQYRGSGGWDIGGGSRIG